MVCELKLEMTTKVGVTEKDIAKRDRFRQVKEFKGLQEIGEEQGRNKISYTE